MRNENKHSKYKDHKKCNNYPKFINTAGNFVQKKLQLTVIVITWFLYGKHWLQYVCDVKIYLK